MLKKLSLAALVAMGSMSVASATDLSSAIKGVDLKGFLRLRAYHDAGTGATHETRWRTTAAFNFAVPVTDELKFHEDFAYNWNMYDDASTAGSATPLNTHMFLDFSKNGANVLVGKIPVVTPVTGSGVGEALGAGVLATYKLNDSLTFAAAGLDTLANTTPVAVGGNNTYAAAAIYKSDMADVNVWAFEVDGIINYDYVVSADVKALKDMGVTLHVDYADADLDGQAHKNTYKNISATYSKDAVCAKVGFAANGQNGGTVVLDTDAPIAAVFATEQITGIADGTKGDKAIYAKVGYKVDAKLNPYVAYTKADDAGTEALVGAKYAYTKKFGVQVYYSVLSKDDNKGNREARAEFKYKF